MNRIIVFDFFASLGHFKIPYTTTSPLTFPVPPKTSIYGLLGAILGLDKDKYLDYFRDRKTKISLSIKRPIQKVMVAENLINTKNVKLFARMNSRKNAPRTQIRIEFLKNPEYTVYVKMENKELSGQLVELLKNHKTHYSISMGLSECLANFQYIGIYEGLSITCRNAFMPLHSILPLNIISSTKSLRLITGDSKFLKVHLPLEMLPGRELVKSGDFIVEVTGKPIFVKLDSYIYINELDRNIVMF